MRLVFIGTGAIGVPALRTLLGSTQHQLVGVVTQPDRPADRDQRLRPPPIKTELGQTKIPILQPARIRDENAIALIRALAPQLIVVMAYGQILPKSLLEIPTLACLNLHASILPKYRGAAPIQAALVAGERETGITVIYMDEGVDTGDVLLQKKLEILPNDTGGSLHDRLAQLAPLALLEALEKMAQPNPPRMAQDSSEATYAPKLSRAAGRIDWNGPAALIERKIRAFDPWPGAFTELSDEHGKRQQLKVFRATIHAASGEPAGTLLPNESKLLVAAGQGLLELQEVQLAGRRRMTAAEFLRGFSSPRLHF